MHYYKKLDGEAITGLRTSTRPQPEDDRLVEINADEYAELELQLYPEGTQ